MTTQDKELLDRMEQQLNELRNKKFESYKLWTSLCDEFDLLIKRKVEVERRIIISNNVDRTVNMSRS